MQLSTLIYGLRKFKQAAPILLALFLAPLMAQETHDVAPLVLVNATLIDGTGSPPQSDVAIVIKDGLISELGNGADYTVPTNAAVIDLSNHFVVPGLIDAHVHLSNKPNPQAALRKLFDGGVTSVRDMGGDARTLAVLARDAKIGLIRSPDIYYSAVLFGPPFLQDPRSRRAAKGFEPGTAPWSRIVTPDSDLARITAEARGAGATGLKLYSALAPDLVRKIVREAHKQGLKVWSHATIFPSKPSDAVAAGVDVISHSGGLYAEARPDVPANYTEGITEWMPEQDFASVDPTGPPFEQLFSRMIDAGTILEPTVGLSRRRQSGEATESQASHLVEAARRIDFDAFGEWACAATRAAHEAGVTIVAGTDSTPRRDISISEQMEALVECGLSPLEALQAATLNGARAIGIEETHGSVEVGKVADLAILGADPTESISHSSFVLATVKAGRLYDHETERASRPTGYKQDQSGQQ